MVITTKPEIYRLWYERDKPGGNPDSGDSHRSCWSWTRKWTLSSKSRKAMHAGAEARTMHHNESCWSEKIHVGREGNSQKSLAKNIRSTAHS